MNARNRFLSIALVLVSLLVMSTALARAATQAPVFPPDATPFGKTYGEWGALWWQWAVSQPAASNPLLDTTGDFCQVAQPAGPVWFLAGTTGGTVRRTCAVPAGKALLIPVANVIYVATPENMPGDTGAAGIALNHMIMASVKRMSAEVDGVSVGGLAGYDTASPIFTVVLPESNIFGPSAPAIRHDYLIKGGPHEASSEGVYLMIGPLSPGQHVIHVHAHLAFWDAYGLDVTPDATYDLTVG